METRCLCTLSALFLEGTSAAGAFTLASSCSNAEFSLETRSTSADKAASRNFSCNRGVFSGNMVRYALSLNVRVEYRKDLYVHVMMWWVL